MVGGLLTKSAKATAYGLVAKLTETTPDVLSAEATAKSDIGLYVFKI